MENICEKQTTNHPDVCVRGQKWLPWKCSNNLPPSCSLKSFPNQELSSPPPHPTKEGWSFLSSGETTSIHRMKGWEQGKEEKKIKSIRMQSLEQMWNGEAMFLGGIMYLDLHRLQLSWSSFFSNFLVTLGCWCIEFMHFQEPEPHLEALPNLQHSMTSVFSSVAQSCLTLRDPMEHSMPGLPVHHQLPKLMSIESVMPSNHLTLCHPLFLLPSIFPQYQGLFKWVSSSHQVAKVLEFQLQHQSFQWTLRTDLV